MALDISGIQRGLQDLSSGINQGAGKVKGKYAPNITAGMSMEDQRKEMERAQGDFDATAGGLQGSERAGAQMEWDRQKEDFRNRQADDARKNQISTVEQLEKDAPGLADRAYGAAALGERRNLAQQMAGIKQGANRRGLLYSGMKQGAEAGAQASSAAKLAGARVDINRNVGNMVKDAKNKVVQGGLDLQASQQSMEDAIYGQALSNYQSKVAGTSAIAGAAGTVAGAYLGGGF